MSRSHDRSRSLLVLLFLVSLSALAACGPALMPEATPAPPAAIAQLEAPVATPTPTPGQFQSPIKTPGPTNTFPPPPTVTPEPPTPTIPPFPTPRPTPVVTPIPTAVPPIIPLAAGQVETPYMIAFRTGNVISAVRNDGTGEQVLLDVHAQTPLFLVSQDVGVETWGNPSPDGSQLALVLSNVVSRTSLGTGEEADYSIHVFDLPSMQLRPLVEDGIDPVWSPDGTRIAYRSTRTQGLWIVDVATGQQREIYPVDRENEHMAINFDWAPDSRRLVLVDSVFRQSSAIVVVEADGGGSVPVLMPPNSPDLFFPQWSPDGGKILYFSLLGERSGPDYPFNLWVMNPDGSSQTQITRDISLAAGVPRWSPDGDWIAFTGVRYYEETEPLTDLWLTDRSGTVLKRLTSNAIIASNEWLATWSPEGTQLIVVTDLSKVWNLSLVNGMQTELRSVTPDFIVLPLADG